MNSEPTDTASPGSGVSPRPVELLAPAGNFEKLKIAIHYGADAVYVGGRDYSLRNQADNFTEAQLREAVAYTHGHGARIYVALNVFARNGDLPGLIRFIDTLAALRPDGIIVSDPGVVRLIRQRTPGLPIHLSTQANTTNHLSARFWQEQGVARINAARELSLTEVAELAAADGPEIEVFVHGAMCIAYSGRCLLSSYLTGRDGNQGLCTQTCRWPYRVTEETRPGQYFPLEEDGRGSYVFSSRDLCMLDHLPALIRSGVRALKIEGRMKGIHYLATVVGTYRQALDAYYHDPDHYRPPPRWQKEVAAVSRRELSTGFYFGDPSQIEPQYGEPRRGNIHIFIAKVVQAGPGELVTVEVRNRLTPGMAVEVLSPRQPVRPDRIESIRDDADCPLDVAHPGQIVQLRLRRSCQPWDLIREKQDNGDL